MAAKAHSIAYTRFLACYLNKLYLCSSSSSSSSREFHPFSGALSPSLSHTHTHTHTHTQKCQNHHGHINCTASSSLLLGLSWQLTSVHRAGTVLQVYYTVQLANSIQKYTSLWWGVFITLAIYTTVQQVEASLCLLYSSYFLSTICLSVQLPSLLSPCLQLQFGSRYTLYVQQSLLAIYVQVYIMNSLNIAKIHCA